MNERQKLDQMSINFRKQMYESQEERNMLEEKAVTKGTDMETRTIPKANKNIKYNELERMVQDTLESNDYKTFNKIITDLYNAGREDLFFRLFVNYDHSGGKLTKAMFKAMK